MQTQSSVLPSLQRITTVAEAIAPHIIRTPVLPYYGSQVKLGGAELWLKLELLQRTGSFKPRGALNVMMQLDADQKQRGVTAFSAGNHAIATAYAASILGLSAKVVMPTSANPFRVERCRSYGAEVVFGEDIAALMSIVSELEASEGRTLVHPFEGEHTTAGTATLGLELLADAGELDAVVVPVGGGGLISGVASAVKQLQPGCAVFGVEPAGACGMSDSLRRGEALPKVEVNTIADSLGAPLHLDYSFSVIQQTVDDIVTVTDDDLRAAMRLTMTDLKLAVEPAGAAALAAYLGPLRDRLRDCRTGLVVCGSNIDPGTYTQLLQP